LNHNEEFMRRVVAESFAVGATVNQIAKKNHISASTLRNWRKAYEQGRTTATGAGTPAASLPVGGTLVEQLQAECMRLRIQNDLLRDMYFEQEFRHRGGDISSWRGAALGRPTIHPTHIPQESQNGTGTRAPN
jgi:transposase-like protein